MISTVLHQHAEGASSLWLRRDRAVVQPHYRLTELAKLDLRLEGHLDGLRIAGDDGWRLCREELCWKGPGEVFAAALHCLRSGDQNRCAEVVAVAVAEPEAMPGLISALGWLDADDAAFFIEHFIVDPSPELRCAALAAVAIHRRQAGIPWTESLTAFDPMLRARALKAAGELGRVDLVGHARANLSADDAKVRHFAAWSASMLSADPAALAILRSADSLSGPWHDAATEMALRRMKAGDAQAWHSELRRGSAKPRIAIRGSGALGIPDVVPWLLGFLETPPLARVAGEAFAMITGVDIAYQKLDQPRPKGFESGPTEDPADDNVDMDPDENLPWPDRDKTFAWWKMHESTFTPGARYLLGKPITEDWLEQVLRDGYQRQRAAAALELAIRRPGTPLFEVRAPGFRQLELIS